MREPGASGRIVLRARVIANADGNERRGVILFDPPLEAFGEKEVLVTRRDRDRVARARGACAAPEGEPRNPGQQSRSSPGQAAPQVSTNMTSIGGFARTCPPPHHSRPPPPSPRAPPPPSPPIN